jgi:hypothetical protein
MRLSEFPLAGRLKAQTEIMAAPNQELAEE